MKAKIIKAMLIGTALISLYVIPALASGSPRS